MANSIKIDDITLTFNKVQSTPQMLNARQAATKKVDCCCICKKQLMAKQSIEIITSSDVTKCPNLVCHSLCIGAHPDKTFKDIITEINTCKSVLTVFNFWLPHIKK